MGRHTVKDGTVSKLQKLLYAAKLSSAVYSGITGEPTDEMVADGLAIYEAQGGNKE